MNQPTPDDKHYTVPLWIAVVAAASIAGMIGILAYALTLLALE